VGLSSGETFAVGTLTGLGTVSGPKHPATEFLAYEGDCRAVLTPLFNRLLDMAESAGWNRRIVASTLMFLAAQQVTATKAGSGQA
jgi:hypothetical protein